MKKIIEFFTKDGSFMAHLCGALTHFLTMFYCLYYSWLIQYPGGSIIAGIISAIVTFFFCWWKEKTDKTGFSKKDLGAGAWGIGLGIIISIVSLNIHNGV